VELDLYLMALCHNKYNEKVIFNNYAFEAGSTVLLHDAGVHSCLFHYVPCSILVVWIKAMTTGLHLCLSHPAQYFWP